MHESQRPHTRQKINKLCPEIFSNGSNTIVVIFKEEHVNELDSRQEDSLFIIILAGEVNVVLVSHGEAFIDNTEMFLLEVTNSTIGSGAGNDFEVEVFCGINAASTVLSEE